MDKCEQTTVVKAKEMTKFNLLKLVYSVLESLLFITNKKQH